MSAGPVLGMAEPLPAYTAILEKLAASCLMLLAPKSAIKRPVPEFHARPLGEEKDTLMTDEGAPDPATTDTLPVLKEKKDTRPPQDSEMKMPLPSLIRAKFEGPHSVTLKERPNTDPG